ncbi:MAG: hypothetical protein JSU72_09820 [Deltaproteobacteria bacterium]|nr:MAG: hypothetical protein JSU72_09820 [Deltaproteobacteria bacterium]
MAWKGQTACKIPEIAGRTINKMIKASALGDLYRIYTFAKEEGFAFNDVDIPIDLEFTGKEDFDPEEMKRLFNVGYSLAISGDPWKRTPPGLSSDSR